MDDRIVEGALADVLTDEGWKTGTVETVYPGHTAALGSTPGTVGVKLLGGGRVRVEPDSVQIHEG